MTSVRRRLSVRITGVVQGVGFRPHVHRMATELHLRGSVANGNAGVVIELDGDGAAVEMFLVRLAASPPPLARISSISVEELPVDSHLPDDAGAFRILASGGGSGATALVPADTATCADCLRELADPTNRRYGHPFINCTNCGPRFTIAQAVPYDRVNTTMAAFPMCAACEMEYHDPTDRRFHAEPICCPECGPRLRFIGDGAKPLDDILGDAAVITATVDALRAGAIVAIKGIGGYHLGVSARDEEAVRRLRQRKHRDEKPFALLVADVEAASRVVWLNAKTREVLGSAEAPIVLAPRQEFDGIAASVAPGNSLLGVMLPGSGLQHLLARAYGLPLVMTSGNRSDDPIAFDDHDAIISLTSIADAFLLHNRRIHRRADDSVVRVEGRQFSVLRRARGYAPRSLLLGGGPLLPSVLGVGAELKSTVCMGRGSEAVMSAHLGDLENIEVLRSFTDAIGDLQSFLGVEAGLIVHDMHPEYLSTKWALNQDADLLAVQHHHAHVASCIAEHGFDAPVVGLAFDGHGFGTDGTLWGGECLVADLRGYQRVGHLAAIALPGGTTAIRQPWRMAVAYLERAYEGKVPVDIAVRSRNETLWSDVAWLGEQTTTIRTSSMGRLFDAVAAILGIRDRASYEGQAAIELEQAAWGFARRSQSRSSLAAMDLITDDSMILEPFAFIRSLVQRQRSGTGGDELAWLAHRVIADASVQLSLAACDQSGLSTVALSGGVFQNSLLTALIRTDLEVRHISVLTHHLVPANDGGISLGQVAIGRAALGATR